uniref:Galectin n=1 Tax=Panagrellus redivivus TaxID=6233 RepID=A0A7E4VXH7_PANRE
MQCLILLLFLATVQGENLLISEMDEHRCLGPAWVADGHRNRYISKRKSSLAAAKTMISGEFVYAYSRTFREGQTLHILTKIEFGYYGGDFSFNLMGGYPVLQDNSGATVLHIKFTKPGPTLMPPGVQTLKIKGTIGTLSVIGNTRKNGEWMSEIKGKSFIAEKFLPLAITALADKFEVRAYGEVILEYPYRMPLDHVQYINGFGVGLNVNLFYLGGQISKAPWRNVFPDGGIKPGDSLIIYALSLENFKISFTDPDKNFASMLDIRVNFDKKTVIFNSKMGERPGKSFEMEIRFFEKTLTVYVDSDKELATFDYRALPLFREMNLHDSLEVRDITVCKSQK